MPLCEVGPSCTSGGVVSPLCGALLLVHQGRRFMPPVWALHWVHDRRSCCRPYSCAAVSFSLRFWPRATQHVTHPLSHVPCHMSSCHTSRVTVFMPCVPLPWPPSQLCLSYINLYEPRRVRQQELLQSKHFQCTCERCSEPMPGSIDRFLEVTPRPPLNLCTPLGEPPDPPQNPAVLCTLILMCRALAKHVFWTAYCILCPVHCMWLGVLCMLHNAVPVCCASMLCW